MNISIILTGILTVIFFMAAGILSVNKPDIVGADFYWSKYKWFYIPKYKKATNKYYEHQIQVVGLGLIASAVVLIVFISVYIIYPPILLLFSYS